jgi:uncharacterized glyoxalase superfamily protein PhnB
MRKLYSTILNLPISEENENFIMYDTKGSRLAFHRLKKTSPLQRSTVELHFEVNDVDEVYSGLQKSGIKFNGKPMNRPWGTRMASFHDPEGYIVEIVGPLKQGEPVKGPS